MKHYANCSQKGLMVIESNLKPWYISLNFNFFILSIQIALTLDFTDV